ncbi:MAG: Rap1a/Tai family immunity protein [Halioglobus sp.]
MSLEVVYHRPQNRANLYLLAGIIFISLQIVLVPSVKALEVLSAQELASHCKFLGTDPEGVDGQYCIRYVQGFIDGAIATDARVMLNTEMALKGRETFTERAMRTRSPTRADRFRAANLAGFCLGDPLPLREVVDKIVTDLAALPATKAKDEPAMEVVYQSLQQHYPCKS